MWNFFMKLCVSRSFWVAEFELEVKITKFKMFNPICASQNSENFQNLTDFYETRYQETFFWWLNTNLYQKLHNSKRCLLYGSQNLNLVNRYFRIKSVFSNSKKFLLQSFIKIRQFYGFFLKTRTPYYKGYLNFLISPYICIQRSTILDNAKLHINPPHSWAVRSLAFTNFDSRSEKIFIFPFKGLTKITLNKSRVNFFLATIIE